MADKLVQFKGTVYEEGYGIVAKKVMKDNDVSTGARCLYAYLCTFIDIKGGSTNSFPGRNKICFDLKISKDTFGKYKKELETKGYITVTQIKNGNQFSHNVYSIESIPCPKFSDTENSDTKISDTKNLDIKSTSIKSTSIKSTNIKYSTQFLEWYSLYPHSWNKDQSFKNFKKLLKEESFENLMAATKNYITYLQQKGNVDKQYITRSTNFIGQKKEYLGYLDMDMQEEVSSNDKVSTSIETLKELNLEGL